MPPRELVHQARSIPRSERGAFLEAVPETELHGYLAALFSAMEPDYRVAVTHGVDELGKDLVLVRHDKVSTDVTAVVVKRGDIKGRTLGDVDQVNAITRNILRRDNQRRLNELESQIAQALAHKADIPTVLARLPVTRVMVILVGAASKQARIRLRHERVGLVEIRDVDWLIDRFTEHYPQVFFRGRTVDYLQERLAAHESSHFLTKTGKALSDYYVEPLVTKRSLPLDVSEDELAVAIREKRIRVSSLRRVLDSKKCVLLVGDPGSGKSTALAKLTIDQLTDQMRRLVASTADARMSVPLLVRAGAISATADGTSLLHASVPDGLAEHLGVSVLMIDGLDEVPGENRERVLRRAREFGAQLNCAVLVASRKIGAVTETPTGFVKYELLPFEFSQAMKLVTNILQKKSALPALREGIQRLLHELPMNPLSLMLLVELVEERQEVPASVTELYDRFADMALGRYDRDRGILVLFEYLIKKRFLARLAFELFYQRNSLTCPSELFDQFVSHYAAEYGWEEELIVDFVKEIERASIIEMGDEIVFRHRSFLDYFVAVYIFDNRLDVGDVTELITAIYFDDLWSDVAFYFVGLGREMPRHLLDALISYTPEAGSVAYEKLTLGRLLQAGWYSPTRVKADGIAAAIRYAKEVRDALYSFADKADLPTPHLMSDFITLMLTDMAFGSVMLQKESRAVLQSLIAEADLDEVATVSLFGAVFRHLPEGERSGVSAAVQQALRSLAPADEARAVMMMMIGARENEELTKALSRRVRSLRKKAPREVRALLPPALKPVRGRKGS